MKEFIISKQKVDKESDITITVRETIPQPSKVMEKTLTVGSIKKAIADCEKTIELANIEKANWQKILDDNSSAILESIK
jgi:fructose-specific component phosphotransferase system IIB-like protein